MSKGKLDKGQFRQGDVLIAVAEIIETGVPEPKVSGETVLAHGEVTGHKHRFERASETQALTGARIRQLLVNAPAALLHEEHLPIEIPAGRYDLPRQCEWSDADEPRTVAD